MNISGLYRGNNHGGENNLDGERTILLNGMFSVYKLLFLVLL